MTWLGYVVIGALVFAGIIGFKRGLIREIVSTLFVILTIAAAWFINPYVNEFLKESTPLYQTVHNTCTKFVDSKMDEVSVTAQSELLNTLNLPDFLKNKITESDTAENYRYLAADTFTEYLSEYLAVSVINGLSFGISYLLATILIRVATYALDILARLPVINGANRIAGAAVGLAKGVIYLWIVLLIATVLCSTQLGETILEMVNRDVFLSFVYEKNIFIRIFMNIF